MDEDESLQMTTEVALQMAMANKVSPPINHKIGLSRILSRIQNKTKYRYQKMIFSSASRSSSAPFVVTPIRMRIAFWPMLQ